MPLRGKRSVAGSSFHELQIAPELFTTGRRLQRPDTHTEKENTHTSDTDMVVCVCVSVCIRYSGTSAGRITTVFLNSPQMELILAVGRKLSTKSDIRLPNSWRREINNVKACIDLLTISSVKV